MIWLHYLLYKAETVEEGEINQAGLLIRMVIVTAQLNLNSTQLNSSWSDYIITVLPTTTPPQTFKALPGKLGS